ncbi:MAG: archaellin/type IV pilin N-terminal domain-containing protein [Candidatus Aenigmatarchaeota archaeon]
MEDKGVSPLIAAVILVAIVMTVAVLVSGFLNDFVGERERGAREDAQKTLDCTAIYLEINTDSISENEDGDLTFFLSNRNEFPIYGIRVVTYTEQEVETDTSPEPENLDSLVTKEILVNETVDSLQNIERIDVRNSHCPNFEATVARDWQGEWIEEY